MCSNNMASAEAKIEGGCQSGRKVVAHDSKSDLLLVSSQRTKEKESQTSSEAFTKLSPGNIQARGRQGDGRYD